MTTRSDIRNWLNGAKKEGATHMLVVCDTFSYEDYTVNVLKDEKVKEKFDYYNDYEKMSKVIEVYDLSKDIEKQLDMDRCFNF